MNPLTNAKNLQKLNERELNLGLTNTSTSWHSKYKDSAWIFVGGLPYELTEGDIICVFSQFGELVNINLVRDKDTGKSKGYCFICYEDQRSTILAVDNLNTIKLMNRTIRVDHVENYRVPKEYGGEDDLTKQLHTEGCAPTAASTSTAAADMEMETKSVKKEKKKKKKKDKTKLSSLKKLKLKFKTKTASNNQVTSRDSSECSVKEELKQSMHKRQASPLKLSEGQHTATHRNSSSGANGGRNVSPSIKQFKKEIDKDDIQYAVPKSERLDHVERNRNRYHERRTHERGKGQLSVTVEYEQKNNKKENNKYSRRPTEDASTVGRKDDNLVSASESSKTYHKSFDTTGKDNAKRTARPAKPGVDKYRDKPQPVRPDDRKKERNLNNDQDRRHECSTDSERMHHWRSDDGKMFDKDNNDKKDRGRNHDGDIRSNRYKDRHCDKDTRRDRDTHNVRD